MNFLNSPIVQGAGGLLLLVALYATHRLYLSFYNDLPPGPDRTRLAVSLTISTIKNLRRAVTNQPAPPEPPRTSNPKFSGTISEPIRPPFVHTKHEGDE